MVVSDLDDMYIPLAGGFLVDPLQSQYVESWLLCCLSS